MADVLGHPDRRDRVELLAADVAVVLQPDLDPIGHARPRPPARGRGSAWASLIVMPTTVTSKCVAAWITIEPHPHPTSSSRPPVISSSPSLRQIRSCFGRLGGVEVGRVVDEAGTRVRHRRAEHQPVEVVADVVVVLDRGGVAPRRVAPAVQRGLRAAAAGAAGRARRGGARPGSPAGTCPKARRGSSSGSAARSACRHLEDVAVGVELARRRTPGRGPAGSGSTARGGKASGDAVRSVPTPLGRADAAAVPELDAHRRADRRATPARPVPASRRRGRRVRSPCSRSAPQWSPRRRPPLPGPRTGPHDLQPVTTGRAGSTIQPDHDGGYIAGRSPRPATSSASSSWAAVTPLPQ